MVGGDASDFVAIGRDHHGGGNIELDDASPDAYDERKTGEKTEGFAGETSGTQSGWDDSEHSHAWRSPGGGVEGALTTAKITY